MNTADSTLIMLLGAIISALLAMVLQQVAGMRKEIKELIGVTASHDKQIGEIKQTFKLNGCEQPGPCAYRDSKGWVQ